MAEFTPCAGCDEPEACEIVSRCLEPETVSGWQPIETAPKDGTHFLGYYADREMYYLIERVHVEYATHTTWCDRTGFYGITLTHWMPLPEAPAS